MNNSNKERMDILFKSFGKNDTIGILVHPSPDPDALGSAIGFSTLLKEVFDLNSKIFYLGTISHPQNKSLKNVLHISLEDGNNFNKNDFAAIVVLDTDFTGTCIKDNTIKVAVRLDHHDMERDCNAELEDVRPVGSTCSIVWDYLKTFNVSLEDHSDTATAMVLGIKTDTIDFTSDNTTELDMEAFRALLPFADKDALSKVTKFPLPKIFFEIEAKAFKDKEIRNTTLLTFIGEATAHNRDVIPTIADRFVRMDGITTAVVMGIIDNCIVASVRSTDSRVDVNDLCANVFGKENGGGKEGSGGARFPLGAGFEFIQDKSVKEVAMNEIMTRVRDKIFSVLGEKEDKE